MIFETLWKSAKKGELILINGGMCHWHLRQDGQITIREIISIRRGAGKLMLQELISIGQLQGANSIFAKCPADLKSNSWYAKNGFKNDGIESTKTGREVIHWRLTLKEGGHD